jgi:hypothetical protein
MRIEMHLASCFEAAGYQTLGLSGLRRACGWAL